MDEQQAPTVPVEPVEPVVPVVPVVEQPEIVPDINVPSSEPSEPSEAPIVVDTQESVPGSVETPVASGEQLGEPQPQVPPVMPPVVGFKDAVTVNSELDTVATKLKDAVEYARTQLMSHPVVSDAIEKVELIIDAIVHAKV